MSRPLSRSASLARDLLARIARGELRPGDAIDLPALGRRHGVSRTVVREALADLGGKGLVVARPKIGTSVAPEAQWNLLDPSLVDAAVADDEGPMLGEAAELRRVVEPAIAAAAARAAGRPQQAAVLGAVRALADAVGASDPLAWERADAALHEAIAAACPNRLLRALDRTLAPARDAQRRHLPEAAGAAEHRRRALALQTGLGLAVVRRDAAGASAWALELATLERVRGDGPAQGAGNVEAARPRHADQAAADPRAADLVPPSFVPMLTGAASGGDVPRSPWTADDGFPATETMPAAPAPFSPAPSPQAPLASAPFARTPLSPAPRARLDDAGLATPPVTVPALLETAAPTDPAARAAH
jgi:DNA-binding FadR family transcriptional regulator